MGESLAFSQTLTLQPNFQSNRSIRQRHSFLPFRAFSSSTDRSPLRYLNIKSESALFQSHQNSIHSLIGALSARVVSDSTTPIFTGDLAEKEIEIEFEPNSSGGDGFGGVSGGGGGGGGGGDNREGGSGDQDSGDKKKSGMSMSQKLTLGYAVLVGVGGLMGYLKSGSQKSLISGGISAALLYYVYTELPSKPVFASSVGLGLSLALLGVMGSRFKNSGKIFPAGVVSLVSVIMSGGYLHGIFRSMH